MRSPADYARAIEGPYARDLRMERLNAIAVTVIFAGLMVYWLLTWPS